MIARKNFEMRAVILGSLALGAAYACYAGEDINWDWRNYHEYSAFAWIHGRLNEDVTPAGVQNFFNPLPYLPAYWLRHHVGAPYWGMLLGALHGLNLALIYWFTRIVLAGAGGAAMLASAVVIAAFGPMTLSEVGTSFADILTALPVIAGLGLILSAEASHRMRTLVGAMLIGGAVGLKLTNMVFLIGAGASLLFAAQPLAAMSYFAIGAVAGLLGTGGAWGWMLWQEFGNPVFPFYNAVFRSPEAPLDAITDVRFMPHSLWEAFAYPFYWAVGNYRSNEYPFRDPRFAIAFVLFAADAGVALLARMRVFTRRDKQFLLFFFVAYAMWLLTFSIHRYAVVLELLTAPMVVLLFSRLWRALQLTSRTPARPHRSQFATIGLAIAIALWSQPADWFRRPWSDPYDPQLPTALSSPATYLMIEKPLGYVVPLLGTGSRVYQVSDIVMPIVPGGLLDRRIREGLAHPLPGGVWALHLRGSPPRQCLLDEYGWRFNSSRSCAIIPGANDIDVEACPLQPAPVKKPSGDC